MPAASSVVRARARDTKRCEGAVRAAFIRRGFRENTEHRPAKIVVATTTWRQTSHYSAPLTNSAVMADRRDRPRAGKGDKQGAEDLPAADARACAGTPDRAGTAREGVWNLAEPFMGRPGHAGARIGLRFGPGRAAARAA